jgi:hypothetical protein
MTMARHSGAMRRSPQVKEYALVHGKVADWKVIAKIPPESTHHLMGVIKHNDDARSQLQKIKSSSYGKFVILTIPAHVAPFLAHEGASGGGARAATRFRASFLAFESVTQQENMSRRPQTVINRKNILGQQIRF